MNAFPFMQAMPAASNDHSEGIAGPVQIGAAGSNYTNFDGTGHQTMVGTANRGGMSWGMSLQRKMQGVGISAEFGRGYGGMSTVNVGSQHRLCTATCSSTTTMTWPPVCTRICIFSRRKITSPNFLLQYGGRSTAAPK